MSMQEVTLEMVKQVLQHCRRHRINPVEAPKNPGAKEFYWFDDGNKAGGRDKAFGYYHPEKQFVEFFGTKTTAKTVFHGDDALALLNVCSTKSRDDYED